MRLRRVLISIGLIAAIAVAAVVLVTQPGVQPIRSQPPGVSPLRLEFHVKHLSANLYPRSHDRLTNLERAAQYIQDNFRSAGAEVSVQEFFVGKAKYKNIIARFGPKTNSVLVIGAHYDSHGDPQEGKKSPRGYGHDSHTPGADDNASGVAGLLELARLLGQNQPTQAVELVAFTLEEPPHYNTEHMGSVWHAKSLIAAKRKVRLMLSLEMIGYFSDKPGSQSYPVPAMEHLYSKRGDFITLVGKLSDFGAMRKSKALMMGATDLPVFSINAPALIQGIDFSDHRSYWAEEIPAIMVTDTAFFRNANYHLAEDTYEKLDYRRMAKVVQAVYAIAQTE